MVTPIHDFHCAFEFLAAIPPEPSDSPDQQVLASYSQTVLQAVAETEITLMSFDQARSQCARLAQAAQASKNAADSAAIRFNRGIGTFSEVLDAERAQFEAKIFALKVARKP
jgi:outer membrane protein TolC